VELHRVQIGDGPLIETPLCEFHGQYWPKVGESPEEAAQRTQRARSRMRRGPNDFQAKNEERRRRARERAAAGNRASVESRRREQIVNLPDEETS
jgi:hypothetical protein